MWTTSAWKAWPDHSPSPLFTLEGFSPLNICLDWMHAKYLGHDMFVYGSILSLLVRHLLPHEDPAANLKQVWSDIKWFYNEHKAPSQFRYLNRLSMFERQNGQRPKLRGKAAEVKYLANPLRYVWNKYANENLLVHRQISLYLKLNSELEELLIIHRHEMALPRADADTFEYKCTAMMLLLSSIAEHFLTQRLFNMTQKAHFIQHISMLAKHLNPRLTWCFMGEDMQKRMSGLAKTCVNGQRPGQTIGKMMLRYRVGLHLQFLQHS